MFGLTYAWSHFLPPSRTAGIRTQFLHGSPSCKAPARLEVMATCTGTTAPWGLLEARRVCAAEQAQAPAGREWEARSIGKAQEAFALSFERRFLFLLLQPACTTGPRLRYSHALLCLFCSNSQRREEILLERKVERKISPLNSLIYGYRG